MATTILYVEDNPVNYRLVERVLTAEGFRVLHARDGLEGLQKAVEEQARLDLILMDINLPEIDGYETTARLRAIPGFENTPILAVTVNTLHGDRSRSLAAGCDGYIPKPIDVTTFAEQVRGYLRGRRDELPPEEENLYLREHNQKLVERLEGSLTSLKHTRNKVAHADRLSSVGEMAAGLMHEIRNPLSSISFLAEYLLTSQGRDREKGREYLERIMHNVARMQSLADGVGAFVRPGDMRREPVSLPEVVREVLELSGHEFRRFDVEIVTRFAEGTPPVSVGEGQLHHLLVNLLRNAAQAVVARVEAESGAVGQPPRVVVAVGTNPDDGSVWMEVADNGEGIREGDRKRLFEPFFTTKPRGQGTGLGLYVVRQVAEDLGATIDVQSAVGRGTIFRVTLPRADESDSVIGHAVDLREPETG